MALDLDAIKARTENATRGEWVADVRPAQPAKAMVVRRFEFFGPQTEIVTLDIEADDAEFIAHARQDVPALIEEVERQAALLAKIQAMHREKHGVSVREVGDPDDPGHVEEPYVICDYDKTTWPCKTHRILNAGGEQ